MTNQNLRLGKCWKLFLATLNQTQALVVRKVDNAIHWIIHYPADSMVGFANTYPLDSDLSSG